jgi:hypothetical protein
MLRFTWRSPVWRSAARVVERDRGEETVVIDVRALRGRRAFDLGEVLVHELVHVGQLRTSGRAAFHRQVVRAFLRRDRARPGFDDLARQLAAAEEDEAQLIEGKWIARQQRTVRERCEHLVGLLGRPDDGAAERGR